MSIDERRKPREGSAFATYAHQRPAKKHKPVVFWAFCLISAVSFWGWLYNSAFAYETVNRGAATADALRSLAEYTGDWIFYALGFAFVAYVAWAFRFYSSKYKERKARKKGE